jgi:ribosome-associated translation inhibitor RaiA
LAAEDDATMAAADDMRERIQGLTEKFDRLERKFDDLGKKVDQLPAKDDLTGFKDEIINNFRILTEEAKASARNAAEGYDATLKRIERNLVDLNQKVDSQLSDHGRVLANHNERLAALEPQQP